MPILPKTRNNSQTVNRDRSTQRFQLGLFAHQTSSQRQSDKPTATLPLEAIYATPSVCRQTNGRCWWNLRCGHSRKMFGGLYSISERDQILKHFKGRRHRIELHEFSSIADRAIAFYQKAVRS